MKGITKELIGASATSMILSVLRGGDSYGYEIIRKMKDMTEGKLKWQEAAIYPILKQLEHEKMITSYWKTDDGQRPRKYFSIQEKGVKKLYENRKEWNLAQVIFNKLWSFD